MTKPRPSSLLKPLRILNARVPDPHHVDADPDPAFHFSADADLDFHFDADMDPAPYPSDANLRPLVYRPSRASF